MEKNMSQNDVLAAAAHLHVQLRRKTGRVTDTEWMASNADYAHAIVRFARDKAESDGHTDLLPLAQRLETLVTQIQARVRQPLIDTALRALRPEPVPVPVPVQTPAADAGWNAHAPPSSSARDELNTRYIGRLR
jgi:hypothetical protein